MDEGTTDIRMAKTASEFLTLAVQRKRMKHRHFSLRSCAARMGISASMLSSILNGERSARMDSCEKFAAVLDLSPKELRYLRALIDSRSVGESPEVKQAIEDVLQVLRHD